MEKAQYSHVFVDPALEKSSKDLTPEHRPRRPDADAGPSPIMGADLLPPGARDDAEFDPAEKTLLAVKQPRLARKYGVIRGTRHIPPERLIVGEDDSAPGNAKAAPRLPAAPEVKTEHPPPTPALDEFDIDSFGRAMMADILNNKEQRELIESRLEPMNVEDIIVHNFIEQRVPVIPGTFEPTLRSSCGEIDLGLKRVLLTDEVNEKLPDRYLLDKYAFMSAAAGVVAINGRPFGGPILDAEGNFSDELFNKKLAVFLQLNIHMQASIGVNLFWFETRVRSLFRAETVGNG